MISRGLPTCTRTASALLLVAAMILGVVALQNAGAQQQLRLGDTIQVVSGPLNVRDAPGTNGEVTAQLVQGQEVVVSDGAPHWADGYWWWNISAEDGISGWVAEGDASEVYIGQVHYPHLPQPVRTERALIDAELDGFWVSLADYGPGPGRGGLVFSWGDSASSDDLVPHYWCGIEVLTNGPPFFERVELPPRFTGQFAEGVLQLDDLEVSCTESGGLTIASDSFARTLAFLQPAYARPQAAHDYVGHEWAVARAHTVLHGALTWLEVGGGISSDAELVWSCGPGQPVTEADSAPAPGSTHCTHEHAETGTVSTLLIDTIAGSVTWEVCRTWQC